MNRGRQAFTMVEIVMALGILSGGILVLLGMFSAALRGVNDQELRRTAGMAASKVLDRLAELGVQRGMASCLISGSERDGLSAWDGRKFFVDRNAEIVGSFEEIGMRGYERFDRAHYYEAVTVVDDAQMRSGESGQTGVCLVHIELAWPAARADGTPTPDSLRDRLVVTASIRE